MPGSSPAASRPVASGLTEAHQRALRVIARRLDGQNLVWALTGSTAYALQGLPLVARDIDLQTDAAGAYACERLLAEFSVRPVAFRQAERIRSHFGAIRIEGVDVEIMGDISKRGDDGVWSQPPDLPSLIRWIRLEETALPVLSLQYEVTALRVMGRPERADLIDRWLAENQA